MIDLENLLQLLDTPGKVYDAPGAPDLQLAEGTVEFRDVAFNYERGVPVLKGVSLCVCMCMCVSERPSKREGEGEEGYRRLLVWSCACGRHGL